MGRLALQIELMTLLGDRLPGTSGQDIAKALLGTVPEDIEYHPTIRRYPFIVAKLGRTFIGMPGRLKRDPPKFHRFWRESIDQLDQADLAGARRILVDALREFEAALLLQSTAVSGHAQLVYQMLSDVIAQAGGVGDMGVLSGAGGAEMAVITDIWRASRGELTIDQVIREHGFHGPLEGEVSSCVWREDSTPLERHDRRVRRTRGPAQARGRYRRQAPGRAGRSARRPAQVQAPRARSSSSTWWPSAIPLRGVAKRSFLQGLDVIRACARRIGTELAADGSLADPEDVFYLTYDELAVLPRDARELVAKRRERREEYQSVTIPGAWKGLPVPTEIEEAPELGAPRAQQIQGIGVSAGVGEGLARVVTDPTFAEVEPDEILVASTTDPSWASIMFISSALVIDMGGPISHAAVVARELGIPCVVNTRVGTRDDQDRRPCPCQRRQRQRRDPRARRGLTAGPPAARLRHALAS